MQKLQSILISTRTMAVLLLVYAASMGVATFIENDYGTPAAKALIYNAKWFEVLMLLLILNFIGNIKRYRLYRREKWPVLMFHLAFILLFIGGTITRYISYEGMMNIREGATSNQIISEKQYFKIQIEQKGEVLNYEDVPYLMHPEVKGWSAIFPNQFKAVYDYNGKKISVKSLKYIYRKKDSLQPDPNGTEYLHIVSAGQSGRINHYLKSGEVQSFGGTLVSYNRPIAGAVEFRNENGQLMIKTPSDAQYLTMATQTTGSTKKDIFQPLAFRSLYTIGDLKLVIPEGLKKGKLLQVEGDKKRDAGLPDILTVEVQGPKTKQEVELPVRKGDPDLARQITLDGMNIILGYGSKVFTAPFALKLDKFVMETYPGSSSPSSFESHVRIIDEGKSTPYNIYMNHVLNYKGYRFFQASFDPDRKGTQLSVNHDFWGTLITYIGYTFLFLGLIVTTFWKGSRFWDLNKMLKEISKKKIATILVLGLSVLTFKAQNHPQVGSDKGASQPMVSMKPRLISADEIVHKVNIDKDHADKFGYLLVQNIEGRIVPVNTMALDILRKLYKHDEFNGLTANQWFLSISTDPFLWAQVPLIHISSNGGEKLLKITKANEEGYTSLMSLFPADITGQPHFVLENDYQTAFRKRPADQSEYDRQVIAVNDQVQVFNGILAGQYLKIVPVQNDPNHAWHSWMNEKLEQDYKSQQVMGPYFASVLDAEKNHNWAKADIELKKLSDYQQLWGKSVVPDKSKVDIEVFINHLNLNFKLLIFYSILGSILLVLAFIELFKPNKTLNLVIKTLIGIGVIGYILHFLGLVARWYVSGHAPWSNGYEAIIFISWIGITAGLMLYRNSNALIPAAGFLVAVMMMGFAHGGAQLDPQITPLVPVLKSYWLIVHVAIITSCYGFFGLSSMIAIITLVYYIVASKKSFQEHNNTTIKELTIVSEMSMMIGLIALVIGVFLGGIWANESWGRYWSWDPKETWAFISVMVYAFVLHMRLVPGLRGRYTYHVVAMFAFCSMVMTYFGVNYYLSGLHSYAKGDRVPVPNWIYISLALMIGLSIAAYFKYKNLTDSGNLEKRTESTP